MTALKNLLSWGSIVRKSNLTLNPFLDVWHVGQIADDRQTGEAKVEGLETEEGHDVAGTSARSAVDEHDGNRQGGSSHGNTNRSVFRCILML